MKRFALILALAMLVAGLGFGCSQKEALAEETTVAATQRELYTFQNATTTQQGHNPDAILNADLDPNVNPLTRFLTEGEDFPPLPFPVDFDFTTINNLDDFDQEFSDVLMMWPEDNLGKTIRIIGPYSYFLDDEVLNKDFHSVLVDDKEGCCQRTVEFEWSEGNDPKEYPEELTILQIVGVLKSYDCYFEEEDMEWTNFYLEVDDITIL